MIIPRFIKSDILQKLQPQKAVIIYGPRQVGKTTLIKEILQDIQEEYMFVSGEDRAVSPWLSSGSIETLKTYLGAKRFLVVDEAQKISEIGLNFKLLIDHITGIKILATGSSSFELASHIGEPLVGRKWEFLLYPIAQLELSSLESRHETEARLESRLIYGSYPDVINSADVSEKREILNAIVDQYLYKDLLMFDEIRKSQKIIDILKLIAFQIGKEVSLHEIALQTHINGRTVEKYLDLLEKAFVVKRVRGFSRNARKEISKNSRYYFYDNGVRNAIINNMNDLKTRNDVGQLWENYLFMERMKKQEYQKIYANNYFWRTYDQKEIDLIEERDGKLFGYEFKWGAKAVKAPQAWRAMYKEAKYEAIHKDNYLEFIT
ncbi:MAG: AAA ATPase [Parcubacteria group bacterium GW2011_GWA2_44_12]|nr:MAG: AAA ATPase [Parcubacteria group bacterium GW2011_GWA2_44_12]